MTTTTLTMHVWWMKYRAGLRANIPVSLNHIWNAHLEHHSRTIRSVRKYVETFLKISIFFSSNSYKIVFVMGNGLGEHRASYVQWAHWWSFLIIYSILYEMTIAAREKNTVLLLFEHSLLPDPGASCAAHKCRQTHSVVHRHHPVQMSQHLEVDCMNTILVNHNPFDLHTKENNKSIKKAFGYGKGTQKCLVRRPT